MGKNFNFSNFEIFAGLLGNPGQGGGCENSTAGALGSGLRVPAPEAVAASLDWFSSA